MRAEVRAIHYYFPECMVDNVAIAAEHPDWGVEKIRQKTGIDRRYIARGDELASDMAVAAATKLFEQGSCVRSDIDFILLCTQSPDYFLPTTACMLQARLGLSVSCGALDFNLGCSGYVYGLGLATGLVESNQARSVLLITSETYSKFIDPDDRGARTIFGDAAAATLIQAVDSAGEEKRGMIGPFVYGTDGSGAENLIVRRGGLRQGPSSTADGQIPRIASLYMNGPEIFTFTLQVIPSLVDDFLRKCNISIDDVDLFVFHQANKFMLEHLRTRIGIPSSKFFVNLESCGNTVSSTIPIALKDAWDQGVLRAGHLVLIVGFGVGYSWGAALIRWPG